MKMELTTIEKIKILMKRKGMTLGALAEASEQTRQNLSNKMGRNNFSEKELRALASALGCDVAITFIDRETGEQF